MESYPNGASFMASNPFLEESSPEFYYDETEIDTMERQLIDEDFFVMHLELTARPTVQASRFRPLRPPYR